jgi:hypothetical protein
MEALKVGSSRMNATANLAIAARCGPVMTVEVDIGYRPPISTSTGVAATGTATGESRKRGSETSQEKNKCPLGLQALIGLHLQDRFQKGYQNGEYHRCVPIKRAQHQKRGDNSANAKMEVFPFISGESWDVSAVIRSV